MKTENCSHWQPPARRLSPPQTNGF